MISFLSTVTIAASLTSLGYGSAIPDSLSPPSLRRDVGILRLPVHATRHSRKRQSPDQVENYMTGTRYVVDFAIGTPPQLISLTLDTGSSETWVNPTCSSARGDLDINLCNRLPRYAANASSTAVDLGATNDLIYGKGTCRLRYYSDNVDIGGTIIKGQQFGVSSISSSLPTGFIGVGTGIELTGYPAILDSMATQGLINSRAFSLDLRSFESPDGTIIFGGIDTGRYRGPLEKLPIIPVQESPDKYPRYWVHVTSIGITKPGEAKKLYPPTSTDPKGQPAFLDSGGTVTRLPTALVAAIVADFPGAVEDGNTGIYAVDCAVADMNGTVDFGFGNTVINVPYQEFMWHISGFCYLGLAADDKMSILGASFLRAAFLVVDQDNRNIHLANSANCGTNLVAIGKGVDAVPSLTGDCAAALPTSPTTSNSTSRTASGSRPTPTPTEVLGAAHIQANHSSIYSTIHTTVFSTLYVTKTQNYMTSTAYSTAYATSAGVITQKVVAYTTICPLTEKATPTSSAHHQYQTNEITKTFFSTMTYTISTCPGAVTYCPYNQTAITTMPVSTSVHTERYMVATIGGIRVAPYELIANPAPVAPAIPIVYPVPRQSLPGKPVMHTPVPYKPSIPAAALEPVFYSTVPAFSATPMRTLLADSSAYGTGRPTGSIPYSTSPPFRSAAVMTRGNLWAVAAAALGLLVMA
ncbi:hypothetical protein PZA11_007746 [Diplocarpon coronariae]|uniref:Peptidase A1 domain-containing protein n=1 Tax=Diplocarpon coronariae TaxID=2795749 RepID=A0A218ZGW6_9HELO|nr:hypothetical protein JHW43_002605 [Diplocarpon mali]OWP07299.1 hypothetical protein B2J93_3046 [Marssonina coronariae]